MLTFDEAWAAREDVSRLQNKEEARVFFAELRGLRSYLEIGSRRGFSLWLAAAALAPGSRMYAIDLPNGQWGDDRSVPALCTMADEIGRQFGHDVRVFLGDSHGAKALDWVARELNGTKVDALFLDGDHSLAGVTRDFLDYVPLVKPTGIVALHDIAARHDPSIQVPAFWRMLRNCPGFSGREHTDEQAEHPLGIGCISGAEANWMLLTVSSWLADLEEFPMRVSALQYAGLRT
jgi:predicted O-methyltransferase YrrM